jgi:CheY-like chemotaxis protein
MRNCAVLHAEDDDAMAYLFRAALDEAGVRVSVYRVSDGEQALCFVRKLGVYHNAKRPELLVLDINMPRIDGWTVLSEMQADHQLRTIPVVVLSTGSSKADRDRAKSLGAREYFTKPHTFERLVEDVRNLSTQYLDHEVGSL